MTKILFESTLALLLATAPAAWAQAMRNQEQGRVSVYFEVAENGTIENPEVLASAGNNLDAEVLRVVRKLQTAATPGLLNGQPARVFYVLPVTFRVM